MKAIVYHNYGSPRVLRCAEVEKPIAGDNEVLVKVRAASVNPLDWHLMRGAPYISRFALGLLKPKTTRLGRDVAGEVEAVGAKVTQFKSGDAVFGICHGAFAEYVCASESGLVMKPENATFEQAASVPIAALTALQSLRDKGRIGSGQKVLINGAAGGVGTFAVQIAKSFGAEVTGICRRENGEIVRSLGADHIIDYTQEDFAKMGQRHEVFLDCIGNRSLAACRSALTRNGIYIMVGGPSGRWIAPFGRAISALMMSRFVSQELSPIMTQLNKRDLIVVRNLIESKQVTPVISRSYTLREAPEAIRHVEEGHARGKIIITLQ